MYNFKLFRIWWNSFSTFLIYKSSIEGYNYFLQLPFNNENNEKSPILLYINILYFILNIKIAKPILTNFFYIWHLPKTFSKVIDVKLSWNKNDRNKEINRVSFCTKIAKYVFSWKYSIFTQIAIEIKFSVVNSKTMF